MNSTRIQTLGKTRGFSLIELMVAMLLGLLLLAGIISAFVANRHVYRTNENMARLQETARIVNELMGRDIRAAGGVPCGASVVVNTVPNPQNNWWSDWDAGAVVGYDDSQGAPLLAPAPPANLVPNTDSLVIRSGTVREGVTVVSHAPPDFTVSSPNHGLKQNDLAMVCDPATAAIFQVSNLVGPTTVRHATNLGVGGSAKTFSSGVSVLAPLTSVFWYIGNNNNGGRSLYRLTMNGAPEEIVEDVTGMNVTYLTRDVNTNALASNYVTANNIADWTSGATNLVVAVRVTLQLQTSDKRVGTGGNPITRTLSFTTSIRNRELVQ